VVTIDQRRRVHPTILTNPKYVGLRRLVAALLVLLLLGSSELTIQSVRAADGSLDSTFDGDGSVTTAVGGGSGARAVAVQPNGQIVAAGYGNAGIDFSTFTFFGDFAVVRYGSSGSDNQPPVVTITTPADGAVYQLNELVTADYACQDEAGGSGLAVCWPGAQRQRYRHRLGRRAYLHGQRRR
jgi:hypothetical protein